MVYLILQMWLWLLLAAVIGFAVGWFLRSRMVSDRLNRLEDDLLIIRGARDRMEQENKRLQARLTAVEGGAATIPSASTVVGGETAAPAPADGVRPPALKAPLAGQPDDLKEIGGIGPKLEETLHQLGIFHFHQIANWSRDNVAWIDGYLRFKGRIEREGWIEQAARLTRGERPAASGAAPTEGPAAG